ncbi:MAG: hypothetical protein HY370_08020, partial [Proteobacteria bacterium]|nr:hypothetical protein [Pseudomonadota bacterium]
MLKFGIYKPEQLSRSNLESFFAKKKFIAADLYDQIPASEDADADFIQERILSRLPMANGTFKYTFFQRFESFDDACIQAIRENFSS